eukprot:Skav220320  [mRNA]  locus=scaffold972:146017:155873:+ [translate_table: standard]
MSHRHLRAPLLALCWWNLWSKNRTHDLLPSWTTHLPPKTEPALRSLVESASLCLPRMLRGPLGRMTPRTRNPSLWHELHWNWFSPPLRQW